MERESDKALGLHLLLQYISNSIIMVSINL